MIRINLVDNAAADRRSQLRTKAAPTAGTLRPFLLALLLLGVTHTAYYFYLQQQELHLAQQTLGEQKHNQELAQIRSRFVAHQKQAEEYQRRVQVIEQLRAAQLGPVQLLDLVGGTVSQTPVVWLNTMRDNGNGVDIEGVAMTPEGVADLMSNLQKSGYFRSVEIKESYQDEAKKGRQWFLFTLVCEKAHT